MTTEFRALAHRGSTVFNWPKNCAACDAAPASQLYASYAATSNLRFLGFYVSWRSEPVVVMYPVCRRHKFLYLLPNFLARESFLFLIVLVIAALMFIAGAFGLVRVATNSNMEPSGLNMLYLYLTLAAPFALIMISRAIVPVRIVHFLPPTITIRIRRDTFADKFANLNSSATKSIG